MHTAGGHHGLLRGCVPLNTARHSSWGAAQHHWPTAATWQLTARDQRPDQSEQGSRFVISQIPQILPPSTFSPLHISKRLSTTPVMDPLSGIIQTAATLGQALQFLRSLGEIPNEFKALLEELSTLQSIIRHVEGALTEFKSTGILVPGPGSPLEGIDTSIIVSLKNDLIQVNDHLSALCNRLRKSQPPRIENEEGNYNKERVSKYKWQKEKGNIDKLQEKARKTREQLVLCLSVFNSSQALVQREESASCRSSDLPFTGPGKLSSCTS
jgi:hypothetical protein